MSSTSLDLSSSSGLSQEHYSYLKCWVILNQHGRNIFEQIFLWGFKSPLSDIKKALFELPNYSNRLYRSDFNASQRKKIESGNISEFDLGLFYQLLQKICSLPNADDEQWGREGDSNSLPNMLYRIKMKRNTLAHNSIEMSEKDMLVEVDELRHLFLGSLDAAAVIYYINDTELNEIKMKTNNEIDCVLNSSQQVIVESIKEVILKENELGLSKAETAIAKNFKPIFKSILASKKASSKLEDIEKLKDPILTEAKSIIKKGDPIVKEGKKVIKDINSLPQNCEALGSLVKETQPIIKEAKPIVKDTGKILKKVFKF